MNKRNTKTLERIFTDPILANINWMDVEKLFTSLGGTVEEKGGSIVCVKLKNRRAVFHRPHPSKEAKKGMIKRVRFWLEELEFMP